jgi:DNA ligase D-like protein (predicted 3'-phosphoesterase)
MGLKEYKEKRNFARTTEPEGKEQAGGGQRFVVHEHQASHLHYDLRLEMDGVLKSWAVPKGVPEEPGIKRLAVHVEDHPLEYIDFSGRIPEGQYGAGTVKIWDNGNYHLIKKSDDHLEVVFEGKRLEGEYTLVHTRDKNWLLFKRAIQ